MTAGERNSQEGRRGDGHLHRGVTMATYRDRRETLLDSHLPSRSSYAVASMFLEDWVVLLQSRMNTRTGMVGFMLHL